MLLAYVLALGALSTLAPFDFAWPDQLRIDLHAGAQDIVLNLLMLVPVGFLYRMGVARRSDRWGVDALALGVGLSASLEALQWMLPTRCTSLVDVLFNGLGCFAGARLYRAVAPSVDRHLRGQLSLELPLAHLLYLVTLQAWVASLSASALPHRTALLLPLSGIMTLLIASLYTHRFRHLPTWTPARVSLATFVWGLFATAPIALDHPGWVLAIACGMGGVCRGLLAVGFPRIGGRRFELPTLAWIAPLFVAYVVALAVYPWVASVAFGRAWSWQAGLFEPNFERARVLALVEYLAAFTVLGYASAQARGRHPVGEARALLEATAPALVLALLVALARGYHPWLAARLLAVPVAALFATWGAAIYRTQRHTVRAWLRRQTNPPPANA